MGRSSDLVVESKGAGVGRQSHRLSPEKKVPREKGRRRGERGRARAGYGATREERAKVALLLVLWQSDEEEEEEPPELVGFCRSGKRGKMGVFLR